METRVDHGRLRLRQSDSPKLPLHGTQAEEPETLQLCSVVLYDMTT
jgi:hypothetical protein